MKKVPSFKSEKEERAFWARHDSAEYVDWGRAKRMTLPQLQPSLRTISIRLPAAMLDELKVLANRSDVPYQSLIKLFLAERLRDEFASNGTRVEPEAGPSPRRVRRASGASPAKPAKRAVGRRRR
jgi:predicted DNA binding CopG/RHH family protein